MFKNTSTGKITMGIITQKTLVLTVLFNFLFLDMVAGKLGFPQFHDMAKDNSVGMCHPCLVFVKC